MNNQTLHKTTRKKRKEKTDLEELIHIPWPRMRVPPPRTRILRLPLQLRHRIRPRIIRPAERQRRRPRPLALQHHIIENNQPEILLPAHAARPGLQRVAQTLQGRLPLSHLLIIPSSEATSHSRSLPLFSTSTFVLSLARLVGWLVGFFVDVTLDSL